MWFVCISCAVLAVNPPPPADWVAGAHGIGAVDAAISSSPYGGGNVSTGLGLRARYGFELKQIRLSVGADLSAAKSWVAPSAELGWSDLGLSLTAPHFLSFGDGLFSVSAGLGATVPLHDLAYSPLTRLTALARGETHSGPWRGGLTVSFAKDLVSEEPTVFRRLAPALYVVDVTATGEAWASEQISFGLVADLETEARTAEPPDVIAPGQPVVRHEGWARNLDARVFATYRFHPYFGATAWARQQAEVFTTPSSPLRSMDQSVGITVFARTDPLLEPLWLLP